MEKRTFRIMFWQKLMALAAVPAFGGLLAVSPVTDGWGQTAWIVAGAAAVTGVCLYLWGLWSASAVRLDSEGIALKLNGRTEAWPYAKLLKVKQFGRFRVKMCFDPDIAGKHYHISIDLFHSAGFVDALLDGYADALGRELPQDEEHAQAA